MDITPYVTGLRDQLALVAEPGGEEARQLADRLTAPLEAAFRLALLDALSVAAAEITQEIAPSSVELRLRGRDPELVVVVPPPAAEPDPVDTSADPAVLGGDEAAMTRINLRLPQDLKDRVEDAARQAGVSVNSWLVRSAAASLATAAAPRSTHRSARGGDHYRGWVR